MFARRFGNVIGFGQKVGDCGVVACGAGVDLGGETSAEFEGGLSVCTNLLRDLGIVGPNRSRP